MDDLNAWLKYCVEADGTDLIFAAGCPPCIKKAEGDVVRIPGSAPLSPDETCAVARSVMPADLFERFAERLDYDGSVEYGRTRFRVNVFMQRNAVSVVLRRIPDRIPEPEELLLPESARRFCDAARGLVLVCGPSGSGKSTTLASLVDRINRTRPVHVVTIEDPIEYSFAHGKGVVQQREVGRDTRSFSAALRAALRQNPDVLVIGEMRDLEAVRVGLTMAETGHLVFGTLHTNDCSQAIDRVIDVFPADQQRQVRYQVAACLVGVVWQLLLPRSDGQGSVAAFEVLVGTPAVRAVIREAKTPQLRYIMQVQANEGHHLLEKSLADLVLAGLVRREAAEGATVWPQDLRAYLETRPALLRKQSFAGA